MDKALPWYIWYDYGKNVTMVATQLSRVCNDRRKKVQYDTRIIKFSHQTTVADSLLTRLAIANYIDWSL